MIFMGMDSEIITVLMSIEEYLRIISILLDPIWVKFVAEHHRVCRSSAASFVKEFYVHGFVHRESMSIIVQQDATIYSFIIFLPTVLHVSDDTFTHYQEHT